MIIGCWDNPLLLYSWALACIRFPGETLAVLRLHLPFPVYFQASLRGEITAWWNSTPHIQTSFIQPLRSVGLRVHSIRFIYRREISTCSCWACSCSSIVEGSITPHPITSRPGRHTLHQVLIDKASLFHSNVTMAPLLFFKATSTHQYSHPKGRIFVLATDVFQPRMMPVTFLRRLITPLKVN